MLPEFKVVHLRSKETEKGLFDLIEHINKISPTKNLRLLEIGAYTGESTAIFCQHFKSVITIDCFSACNDRLDGKIVFGSMAKIYEAFLERMSGYSNYQLIKKTSDEAYRQLTDKPLPQYFDVVYIDGDHNYAQVKRDVVNYSSLVKQGGFLTGHDYSEGYEGVIRAVNESYGQPDAIFLDANWVIRKDREKQ